MNKIFSSPDSAEVELLKNMLADAGIECEVRNGDVSRIVPAPPFYEELWVSEQDYPKASELLESWRQETVASGSAWTCPACGERIEPQFSSCWKCGALRPQMA
jgi:hypothetical protein